MNIFNKNTLGIFLAFVGGMGIGASHYVVSILAARCNPVLILWHISLVLFFISILLAMTPSIFKPFPLKEFPILIIRSTTSTLGRLTIIAAFSYVPVYEGDMVRCTDTVFIAMIGCCCLKQPMRLSMFWSLILSTIGILMIYRPPWLIPASEVTTDNVSTKNRVIGILIALASAILTAFYKTLAAFIPSIHYRVVCLCETWIHIVFTTIAVFLMGILEMPHELLGWLLPLSAAITFTIAIISYFQAFKFTSAANGGFASLSFLPTTICLKSIIEHKPPNKFDYIGMLCIFISVAISLFSEHLTEVYGWLKDRLISRNSNKMKYSAIVESGHVTKENQIGPDSALLRFETTQ